MYRRPPISTRPATPFPSTPLFPSRAEGPLAASDFEGGKGNGGWWGWGDTKRALEWLFWAGHITTATRRASFERVYDVSERVIPAAILALPTPAERSEAHTSELQSLMRISYADFCLQKKKKKS